MRKKYFFIGLAAFLTLIVFAKLFLNPKTQISYEPIDSAKFAVTAPITGLNAPTRIKITPDGAHLLITEIAGKVMVLDRGTDGFSGTPYELTSVETHFPGFPAEEGGLVGMAFSADFSQNGFLFLFYSYRDEQEIVKNRIAKTILVKRNGKLTASPPQIIFEANTPGNISHQITEGIGVKIEGKPHLLFLIGEGFKANKAQDPALEAGKVMLIAEDGGNPVGQRPYPAHPKIQAIGLRNAYVLAEIPGTLGQLMLGDTGPDKYDRLIDLKLYQPQGTAIKPINLGWDGSEDKLLNPIADPNTAGVKDVVVERLPVALTYTGLAFHPGKGAIPGATETKHSVLLTQFGKTGSTENEPGKQIVLATLDHSSSQPVLTGTPIIRKKAAAQGQMGNPVGLEVDLATGNFFFADIFEGTIYQVSIK